MANISGTNIASAVRPFTTDDTYAVAIANEIKGGRHTADTVADRNLISLDRRDAGMQCYVKDGNTTYELIGTPATPTTVDADWKISGGGATDAGSVSYSTGTVADALDNLLYVAPIVSSFSNTVNTVELGSTVNAVILNWNVNKTVTSQSIDNSVGAVAPGIFTKALTGLGLVASKTWTITVDDGTVKAGHVATKSTAVNFSNKRYWGTSALTVLSDADIIGLGSEFSVSRVQSRVMDASGGKYLYFAVPTSFGCDASKFKIGGLANSDWTKTTAAFVNASGYSTSYDVFRTNNVQTGSAISVDVV